MKKAVRLYLKEGTTFDILFNDGITKRFDILKLSDKYPQLNQLKDRNLFLKGHLLGWGGVVWNDDLDVESETVYEDGIEVSNDDDVLAILTGYKIKELRILSGLSQNDLAQKSKIPQADISRIERGNLNPSLHLLQKIAKGLNKRIQINFF